MNLSSLAQAQPAPQEQLPLPTGPTHVVRPRRERTDEDRDFLAAAFRVKAGGVSSTALYRCLAYFASLSSRRIAYPSQSTMAGYCDMSVRQVRRVLRKLEQGGVIVCVERKGGGVLRPTRFPKSVKQAPNRTYCPPRKEGRT